MSSEERLIPIENQNKISSVPLEIELIRKIDKFEAKLKADQFLKRSSFLELSTEVASIIRGRVISVDDENLEVNPRPDWLYSNESAFISVLWEEKQVEEDIFSAKALSVEVFSNGTIIVRGNFGGTTILSLKEWENKKMSQMDALTKASKNPMCVQYVETEINDFSPDQKLLL